MIGSDCIFMVRIFFMLTVPAPRKGIIYRGESWSLRDICDSVNQLPYLIMGGISSLKLLPFVAGCAFAGYQYPEVPKDLTTPFQQRLSVYGPDGMNSARDSEPE
jgi:hypothetical protein